MAVYSRLQPPELLRFTDAVLKAGSPFAATDALDIAVLRELPHVPLYGSGFHTQHFADVLGFKTGELLLMRVSFEPLKKIPGRFTQFITFTKQHIFEKIKGGLDIINRGFNIELAMIILFHFSLVLVIKRHRFNKAQQQRHGSSRLKHLLRQGDIFCIRVDDVDGSEYSLHVFKQLPVLTFPFFIDLTTGKSCLVLIDLFVLVTALIRVE